MSTDVKGLQDVVEDRWKRQGAPGEDSRLKYSQVTHPIFPLDRTFCVVCGKPKGWVTRESSAYIAASNIIVICDECSASYGSLGLQEAPIKEIKNG